MIKIKQMGVVLVKNINITIKHQVFPPQAHHQHISTLQQQHHLEFDFYFC